MHVIVYVRDQRAATSFFADVLGVTPVLDVPGMTELAWAGGTLGLMPEAGIERLIGVRPAAGVRAELYLRVDDPGAYHARALAAGAEELSPLAPRSWGDEVAYCLAPDGVVLAFARRSGAG